MNFKKFINKNKKFKNSLLKNVSWELQVYRNVNNLCVYCGKPMVTTVFFDVPVCDEHKNEK